MTMQKYNINQLLVMEKKILISSFFAIRDVSFFLTCISQNALYKAWLESSLLANGDDQGYMYP
jgi:hypothetical protein